jgi:hypothetical protein
MDTLREEKRGAHLRAHANSDLTSLRSGKSLAKKSGDA